MRSPNDRHGPVFLALLALAGVLLVWWLLPVPAGGSSDPFGSLAYDQTAKVPAGHTATGTATVVLPTVPPTPYVPGPTPLPRLICDDCTYLPVLMVQAGGGSLTRSAVGRTQSGQLLR